MVVVQFIVTLKKLTLMTPIDLSVNVFKGTFFLTGAKDDDFD